MFSQADVVECVYKMVMGEQARVSLFG
jgi:hypothetical protein